MDESKMTEAVFYTAKHVIAGKVNLLPGARLTDFMREDNQYLVVADAVVTLHDGTELFKAGFIDLLRSSVEIAVPTDAIK